MTEFADRFGPWGVVTGAAQGVGLAYAEELASRGVNVVALDRSPAVHDVAASLPCEARAVVTDLTEPGWLTSLDAACADIDLGIAVANAGVTFVGNFLDMTADERRTMLAVNNDAVVELAAWALPGMVDRGSGGFVATSSGSAIAGTGGVGLYSATKGFVLSLAEAIGWELRDSGVVTQAVIAPSMATEMLLSRNIDLDAMASAPVDPRTVVARALDDLGNDTMWLADDGLEFMAAVPRRDAPVILSEATTAMYPAIFNTASEAEPNE